ncbi:hypothetical protein CB0940_09000 [Cercospora beticola]|uniref:Uncharacterized protein n=1 Tax=Cercospora beticola TaxID=122368 RepID=A0A2G5HGI9_CERBT|nr:hypothetical protein CB0940_09000 [Cercospora beticola]PIA91649.1 hypothetical protein CB0940_09000 [Cercospora beticola]WPB06729.1 hypothetical protein RHO25_011389 [Cercospora beticola]CAK1366645.1 unnamed protein product [Cercospora beticola]
MSAEVLDTGTATTDLSERLEYVPTPEPTPLRDEVAALIEPWRNADTKPPFTTGELIVIVFVIMGKEQMSETEIHSNILRRFSYYCNLAIDSLTYIVEKTCDDGLDEGFDSPIDDFYDALRDSELPVRRKYIDSFHSGYEDASTLVKIFLPAARIYLRHQLEPERLGTFDFMGLPAELREKVYKMLLIYPKRGLCISSSFPDGFVGLVLTPRQRDSPLAVWEAFEKRKYELVCLPKMREVLSILRVSKQICSETLPIFYRNNLFHFPSLEELQKALGIVGREVRQMIDHMQIDLHCLCELDPSFRKAHGFVILFPDLAPKTLVLQRPATVFPQMCLYEDPASVERRTSFEMNPSLMEFVALAQRAKKLEVRGNVRLKTWLEKKLTESGNVVTNDTGKMDSSKQAICEP